MSKGHKFVLLPEVSLITSWRVPFPQNDADLKESRLPGVYHALREGIGTLDLYLLEHREIPLYAQVAGVSGYKQDSPELQEPQEFLASLNSTQLNEIARWLQAQLVEHFHGRGIGRRPRWGGIATFFPSISVPDDEDRAKGATSRLDAVKALRASLYLAYRLGCPCIEAVGGSRTPIVNQEALPDEYLRLRHDALSKSLQAVYDRDDPNNILRGISQERLPRIAVELEPGPSFLLNDISEYGRLFESLRGSPTENYVGLNADIAHFFLCGHYRPEDLGEYRDHILHMHLSDHAADFVGGGTHASDLVPGLYHGWADYEPWLKLAITETQRKDSRFSGVIAVELEACHSVMDILSAQSTTRRWLALAAEKSKAPRTQAPPLEGALLVVDLGNSTKSLLSRGTPQEGVRRLQELLDSICTLARQEGGTLLSFTGDGFIGLFETCYFQEGTASRAWKTTLAISQKMQAAIQSLSATPPGDISLRCALHWGEAFVPNAGTLREQLFGRDVVCAARLCDWLSKTIETALSDSKQSGSTYAITGEFYDKLETAEQDEFEPWKTRLELKGLQPRYRIYVPKDTFTTRKDP